MPDAFRRIVFTGDVLRPAEVAFRAGQTENIQWFHRLFRVHAAEATGLPVECATWGEGFDTEAAYDHWGVERSWRGWAEICDTAIAPEGVLRVFDEAYGGAVVIGFELSETAKRVLSVLGVPFLDFSIHPVRFLDDVFFAIQTNDPAVFEAMLPYHAESAGFHGAAGLLAASALKFLPNLRLQSDRLLVGQTRVDRSLVRGGRVLDLSDFATTLRAAAAPTGRIAFKPHPYASGDFGLLALGLPLAVVERTNANIYALLASGDVREVIGVSSSVLLEARYFGVPARWLLGSPFDIPDSIAEAQPGQHLSVVDAAFDVDFWRECLAPLVPVTACDGQRWRRPPNSLRMSLRNFWGFNELSTDFMVAIRRPDGPVR
ncbi:hypothetical protein [Muricoccus radiodurans]|uniref:hypothetical protein n=1 Tax=Muricoccus radiodurans TaxID=2231721 RepID=UPI003CF7D0DF